MERSLRNQSRNTAKKEKKEIIISKDQLDMYLSTVDDQQAEELKQFIKNNPKIDWDPTEKFFTGDNNVMEQIRFIIDSIQNQCSYVHNESNINMSQQQSVIKKHTVFSQSLSIGPQNLKRLFKETLSISAVPLNRFQLCLNRKDSIANELNGGYPILIRNRTKIIKKVYIVYEKPYEIIELQTLLEEQIPMNIFHNILQQIQKQPETPMIFTNLGQEKELYCCQRRQPGNWKKFINHMNKKFNTQDIILCKFHLLQEIVDYKPFFTNKLKVVIHEDQIKIDHKAIEQFKVFQNTFQSINNLKDIACEILSKGQKCYSNKDYYLDPISCFNLVLLQQRKIKTTFVVQIQQSPFFIYFTFYRKVFKVNQDPESKVINLQQVQLSNHISNNYYLQAIERIRKHATINSLPFFLISQEAKEVTEVQLSSLKYHQGDTTKLLAYRYLLNVKKFKVSLVESCTSAEPFQAHFSITFGESSPVYKKMGKLKHPDIIKKQKLKEQEKGIMTLKVECAKMFVDKCLSELTSDSS